MTFFSKCCLVKSSDEAMVKVIERVGVRAKIFNVLIKIYSQSVFMCKAGTFNDSFVSL